MVAPAAQLVAAAPSSAPTQKAKRDATGKSYQQPSMRALRTWTPKSLRSIERIADGGRMVELADLCDQLLADERIR